MEQHMYNTPRVTHKILTDQAEANPQSRKTSRQRADHYRSSVERLCQHTTQPLFSHVYSNVCMDFVCQQILLNTSKGS